MKRNIQKIDSLFNESIDAFEEAPPLRVLDALNNHLDKQAAVETSTKRKRWLVAALFLLVTGSGIFTTYNIVNHTEKKLAVTLPNTLPVNNQKNESIAVAKNDKEVTAATLTLKGSDKKSEAAIASRVPSVQSTNTIPASIKSNRTRTKTVLAGAVIGSANNTSFKNNNEVNSDNSTVNVVANNNEKSSASFFTKRDDNKINVVATEKSAVNTPLIDESAFTQRREDAELVALRPLILAETGSTTIPQRQINTVKLSKTALVKYSRPSRWAFTLFVSPEISSRTIEQDPVNRRMGFHDEDKDEISHSETPEIDFTSGILAEYKLNKHLSIQSGISFSNITIDIQPKTIFARYDADGTVKFRFNCSSGYSFFTSKTINQPALGDSINSFASTNTLQYIGIPLSFKYYMPYKRFNFFVHAGVTAKFVVDQTIETGYAVGGIREKRVLKAIQGLKTNYFNGQVGVGADYNLSKHFAVTIAPTINFGISSLNENSPVKSYQHNFAITSGIKFKL